MNSHVSDAPPKTGFGPLILLGSGVILAIALYSHGWAGGWQFDDKANLNALLDVFESGRIDWKTAHEFIVSGDAGPLGRPIALASFLIDGSTWPEFPRGMLYTNSLLHAVNALLLCALWLAVLRQRADRQSSNQWIAVVAGLLWLLQPLLASGVLMAVQRMTLLSSSFMLLGAWLYVLGRERIDTHPLKAWVLILSGLSFGTLLGVFSKEQAVTLPLLLWILERWALRPPRLSPRQINFWVAFKCFAFYLPAIIIGLYLIRIALNHESSFANRDFSLADRLWTQGVVLWDYFRLIIMPRALDFGPFHDDYVVHNASVKAIFALAAWLALLIVFWLLRHKSHWPLFGLLWFAASHIIESTVVPLELYFEHRNYLAIAGPLFSLVILTSQWASWSRWRQKTAVVILAIYGFLLGFVLWQVASVFGQDEVAARLWYEQHPNSVRAGQYLAGRLSESGNVNGALKVLDEISERPSLSGATRLQGLQLACVLNAPREELENRLALVLKELPISGKRFAINDALDRMKILMDRKSCGDFLTLEKLVRIAETAISSPGFQNSPLELSNLNFFIATLYIDSRNLAMSMHYMEAAMDAVPQLVTLKNMVFLLQSAGLHQDAYEIFERYPVKWPRSLSLAMKQKKEWHELKKQVEDKINIGREAL